MSLADDAATSSLVNEIKRLNNEITAMRSENDRLRAAHQLTIEGMKRQAVELASMNDRLRAERNTLITFAKEVSKLLDIQRGSIRDYVTPGHHQAHEWWQTCLGGELQRLPQTLRT